LANPNMSNATDAEKIEKALSILIKLEHDERVAGWIKSEAIYAWGLLISTNVCGQLFQPV